MSDLERELEERFFQKEEFLKELESTHQLEKGFRNLTTYSISYLVTYFSMQYILELDYSKICDENELDRIVSKFKLFPFSQVVNNYHTLMDIYGTLRDHRVIWTIRNPQTIRDDYKFRYRMIIIPKDDVDQIILKIKKYLILITGIDYGVLWYNFQLILDSVIEYYYGEDTYRNMLKTVTEDQLSEYNQKYNTQITLEQYRHLYSQVTLLNNPYNLPPSQDVIAFLEMHQDLLRKDSNFSISSCSLI